MKKQNPVLQFMLNHTIVPILILIFIVFAFGSKNFLTSKNLLNIVQQSAIFGIMAIGMTYLIICGYFDLSAGVTMGMTANVCIILQRAGWSIPSSIIVTLLLGFAIGLVIGLLVTKAHVNAFIVTLAVMVSGRGVTYIISKADQLGGPYFEFMNISNGKIGKVAYISILFIALIVISELFLRYSSHGRDTYAVGGNADAAFNAGIKVDRVKIINFIICSFFCALGGVLTASRMNAATPFLGYPDGAIMVITCVVLGGTSLNGGVGGTLYTLGGTLAYFMMRNGMNNMNISAGYYYIMTGLILIFIVTIDSFKEYVKKKTR